MTDIFSGSSHKTDGSHDPGARPADYDRLVACAELLFFAYRDFTGEPDQILEEFGFGRAHHRVLHFVDRNPGLRVARLLDILKITKQSLARVLKQLIDTGFIEQRTGPQDRRERRLFTTKKGNALAETLTNLQVKRLAKAFADAGDGSCEATQKFLLAMISQDQRLDVRRLTRAPLAQVTVNKPTKESAEED